MIRYIRTRFLREVEKFPHLPMRKQHLYGLQHAQGLTALLGVPAEACAASYPYPTYLGPQLLTNLKLLGNGLAIILPGTSLGAESVLDPLGCVLGSHKRHTRSSSYHGITSEVRIYKRHTPQ